MRVAVGAGMKAVRERGIHPLAISISVLVLAVAYFGVLYLVVR